MALETGTFISDLVVTNPVASDPLAAADDHLRLIKSTVKNTFPNLTAAVTKTAAQINDGLEKSGGTMTGALTLSGNASSALHAVPKQQLDAAIAAVYAVPSGGIIIWSGSSAAVPSGWYLCDGANGTPDLRNRFVVGATGLYAVGATGGSKDAVVVSHTHTATTTVTDPGHTHTDNGNALTYGTTSGPDSGQSWSGSHSTSSATTGITASTTIASTGESGTDKNLPPYYALCYIMKA